MCAAGDQPAGALAAPDVGLPTAVLDHLGLLGQTQWQRAADLGGRAGAQAPSPRARRAWLLPAVVLAPWWRRSPEKYPEEISPKKLRSSLGLSKRGRAPTEALMVRATVHWTPLRTGSASTTGGTRHVLMGACSSCSRRWSRALREADETVVGEGAREEAEGAREVQAE